MSVSQRNDLVVLADIRDKFEQSRDSYGRPRMTEELKELGLAVGHRRVGPQMKENRIKVRRNKEFKATIDSNHGFNIAPNLLNRDFSADRPNQKWAGDISYVWTQGGWLYLAVILELHSRRVIGWAVSNRMKRDLAIRVLNPFAVVLRKPLSGAEWPSRCGVLRKVVSTKRIEAANTVPTTIKSCCAITGTRYR